MYARVRHLLRANASRQKKYGFTGYNIDFEPASGVQADDAIAYAKFLDYFSQRMHQEGIKVTVDFATWSPFWNLNALAAVTHVEKFITMTTYTSNYTIFADKIQALTQIFGADRLGVGLITSYGEGKTFTDMEMAARFYWIEILKIQEVDIWRSGIPNNFFPLLRRFVNNP